MAIKPGDRVSLNLRNRLYFFQGQDGINLNKNSPTATIPEDIDDQKMKQINIAMARGQLIKGSSPEEPVEMPNQDGLKEMMGGGRNKIKDYVYKIREDKKLSTDKKIGRLEEMLKMEKEGKNRKSVKESIDYALSKFAGPSTVTEDKEKEKVEISLTKGTQEEDKK